MEWSKKERVKSSKRLIFDRRYGWVVDEWKQPSEEALSGARGMFSILPLANAFLNFASQSGGSRKDLRRILLKLGKKDLDLRLYVLSKAEINDAASTVLKVMERRGEFSHPAIQPSLNNRAQEFFSQFQKQNFNPFFGVEQNSPQIISGTSDQSTQN